MIAGRRATCPPQTTGMAWRSQCAARVQQHTCTRCGTPPGPPCTGHGNHWERYGAAYRVFRAGGEHGIDVAAFAAAAARKDTSGIVPGVAA